MSIKEIYQLFKESKGVTTDSRLIEKGQIYISLKGVSFNGNKFAAQAINSGASYAIIDEEEYAQIDDRYILVENGLKTLQDLANYHREIVDIPIIAITGSNGKTTTKELIAAVLKSTYRCHATSGNFNNHIGVPLTLLKMPLDTEVAVIEMGANHIGEIADLCKIANPSHGIITNIGKAHLEGFGSLEGVKKGKSELYTHLSKKGSVAFVNLDVPFLEDLSRNCKYRILYKKDNQFDDPTIHQIEKMDNEYFVSVAFASRERKKISTQSQLIGDYNFNNIMSAIVIGRYFRVPAIEIKKSIETYIPSNNRSQIIEKGTNIYLLDAYNANPMSMRAALKNFNKIKIKKSKIAILGSMKELGKYSKAEHQKLLDLANTYHFDQIVLVGEEFEGLNHDKLHFNNVKALKIWLLDSKFEHSYFLIKGSRSNQLEESI